MSEEAGFKDTTKNGIRKGARLNNSRKTRTAAASAPGGWELVVL